MTAIGFRVKSGHAIAVTLEGSRTAPRVIARYDVELSDPAVPETRQPYHDGFFNTEEDAREIARRVKIVKRGAAKSVGALVKHVEREALRLARPEPFDSPLILSLSKDERLAQDVPVEGRARSGRAPAGRPPALRAALVVGSLIDPATVA